MIYVRVLLMTTVMVLGAAFRLEAATATWDRNPEVNVTGYRLSYGTQSGTYTTSLDAGNVITYQFFPPPGQRYYVVVQAYDSVGALSPNSSEFIFDAPVAQNQPPVLTQPANQSSVQNAAVSLQLVASDPEANPLTFSATGLPPGLSINAATGVISGTVTTVAANTVTATVSDGSLTASRTFTWTVTASTGSITLNLSPADTTLNIDSTNLSTDTGLFTYTYPANKVANAILMKFDLSQIPANATVQSAVLQLALTQVDSATADLNYNVSLHQVLNRNPDVTRATGMTADGVTAWTANTCCYNNVPLAQADLSPARATTAVNRTLGAKTWDAIALVTAWRTAPATNFGLVLNSDATKPSDRYRFFASMENATIANRPFLRITYTLPGGGDTTPPTAALTAPANNATVSGSNVTVSATATDAVGVVGVQFKLDGLNIGAEDASTPFSVSWDSTTALNGSHALTAVARDAAGNSTTSAARTVTVSNTVANRAPTLTQPANQTSAEGSAASLTLVGSDLDANPLTYSATGLPSGLTVAASSGVISGTPSYTSAGAYTVTATVSDGSLSASRTFTWTITNTNRAPTLTQPANQTSAEGAAASLALVGSDPDGTALTYSATGLPSGLTINTSSGLISGTLTFTSAGAFSVTATASDGSLSQSRTFTWTITNTNRAPVLSQPANQTGVVSTSASLALSATDPDGTAVTYQAVGLPPALTVNSTTGLISGTLSASSAGVYTVTVTASDGSLTDGRTFTWSVANSDLPVQGDFDGDGRDDPATYRASTGEWRVWPSASLYAAAAPIVWGGGSDVPVAADYDGDRKTDLAVYRPATGTWNVLLSSTNMQTSLTVQWGNASDRPEPIDYDGDGRADLALPRFGGFQILLSGSNYVTSVTIQ